jgi:hypothetical protein
MAGQSSQDLTRQVVDRFKNRASEYASGIAQRMGAPASGVKLDNETMIRLWQFSPHPDPAAAFMQLKAQGMPDGQALDATHPYRRKLFQAPTVKEQIAKAEQLKAMAEGQQQT